MAAKRVSMHGDRTCTVEVAPSEVDAGAELTVTVRASCPHGCDLTGQNVSIRDRDDTERDDVLLHPIVDVALDAAALHLLRMDDARPGCGQLLHPLGELFGQARVADRCCRREIRSMSSKASKQLSSTTVCLWS